MRKKNIHQLIFAALTVISIFSYIYLNTVEVETVNIVDSKTEEFQDQNDRFLPDVKVVKTAISGAKKFIPAL